MRRSREGNCSCGQCPPVPSLKVLRSTLPQEGILVKKGMGPLDWCTENKQGPDSRAIRLAGGCDKWKATASCSSRSRKNKLLKKLKNFHEQTRCKGTCFRAGGQFLISEKEKRRKREKEWAPARNLKLALHACRSSWCQRNQLVRNISWLHIPT